MIRILNKKEKAEIEQKLNQQFGIEKLNFLLLKFGEDKIRGFTGNLSCEGIKLLDKEINIEKIGIYLVKKEKDGIRLGFDAANLLNPKKNIVEIDEKQAREWLKGHNLEYSGNLKGFVILKNKEDFLGCGKSSDNRITNFVPKERRIKS